VTSHPPYLPELDLPLQAMTSHAETVRIRMLEPDDQRVESSSEYDDWGPFDIEFHDEDQGRAMIEVRIVVHDEVRWQPVGDMSWHAEFYGPNLGSRGLNIGLSLHERARGRGIGTVAQSLLTVALHRSGVHRVEASTDPTNIGEQRALERAGFVREGVIRGAQVRADGRHDLVLYSCLPGEPTVTPT
jgi:RimJ/RimL family protein N-acetyltransferase